MENFWKAILSTALKAQRRKLIFYGDFEDMNRWCCGVGIETKKNWAQMAAPRYTTWSYLIPQTETIDFVKAFHQIDVEVFSIPPKRAIIIPLELFEKEI